ncbi:MAG: 8-amino-7-oxononanoate synthase [Reinekea forsetii]|nr:8-amino-7-oxononanoate synthase [Reinekea forsetii]
MKNFSDMAAHLAARQADHLMRSRLQLQSAQSITPTVDGQRLLSFCSNDYLGLANHPAIAQAMKEGIDQYGVGSGSSHLVSGHHREHELLEQELAAFTGREAALVFSSGYMANVGVMSALMSRRDTIVQDRLNHASLIDGALLSQAKMLRFRHNDMAHLRRQLGLAMGKKLVVSDGVFSMDGDCAPLLDVSRLCAEHAAWLLVDDAHGIGVLGPHGSGLVNAVGLTSADVPLLVGTLGKAFGTSGAFVAGDKTTIDYLLQTARPYIYTTATPPALAAATRTALTLVKGADAERAHLQTLIGHLRQGVSDLGYQLMPSATAIQPILVGANDAALQLSEQLRARGLLVTAIRPPTVPVNTARLRVTLSASHSLAQVDQLLNALADIT